MRIFAISENVLELIHFDDNEESKEKKQNRKTKIIVMFIIAMSCYIFSIFVSKLISVISLFSSILCPVFIIIAPSVLSVKLKMKLNLSNLEINFIKIQAVVFICILICSVIFNMIHLINDEDVIG